MLNLFKGVFPQNGKSLLGYILKNLGHACVHIVNVSGPPTTIRARNCWCACVLKVSFTHCEQKNCSIFFNSFYLLNVVFNCDNAIPSPPLC